MSKKLKLSPWHSGDVKPVHVGVYEVRANDGINYVHHRSSYAFYDGVNWTTAAEKSYAFKKYVGVFPPEQNKQWRGILK